MHPTEIQKKIEFIRNFAKASNAADGSKVDANANVTNKDMAVMEAELFKSDTIQINRALVKNKLTEMYGTRCAEHFEEDISDHLIYIHDETSLKPYCVSISLYPYLLEGTKVLGGTSKAPQNLRSFCGTFCNLVYQVASNFAGAVATVEFLLYFDYFARKTYGRDYLATHHAEIAQELQGVVYTMNQPAAARGNQSVFWNISVFDKHYFDSIFGEFYFPDGTQGDYESVAYLQDFFLDWFRKERTRELLTFPVVTAAYLVDKETREPLDEVFVSSLAYQMSQGLSFFHYESDSADSLASCCRLRNELQDNTFSYTLGAGGVSTGSFQVITINLNRITQRAVNAPTYDYYYTLPSVVERVHKYLSAYRALVQDYIGAKLLPVYDAGFISLDKQFGTIGINGALEALEFMATPKEDYKSELRIILSTIKEMNKEAYQTYGFRFNTEFVPAENLGVKNAKWDKEDGLWVPRDCYNSYFFPVEDTTLTVLDRLDAHSADVSNYLDGGAACHINLEQLPSFRQALELIKVAAKLGVPYWTTNVLTTICKECGYINPETHQHCTKCGSKNIEYATRVIGYLKPISSFSEGRRKEAFRRHYMKDEQYEID